MHLKIMHIILRVNSENAAIALLPSVSMPDAFTYTLTMQAIKGDETGAMTGFNPLA